MEKMLSSKWEKNKMVRLKNKIRFKIYFQLINYNL